METTKNEFKQRICCYSKAFDVDLDFQENLEPYNDEMLKILRSSVTNSIVNYDYNNGVLTVHGKSKINITYFNNSDKGLSSVEFDEDFEKNINIEADENSHFDIRLCNKYNTAKIINPTRVDIHNSFSLLIKAYSDKACSAVVPDKGLLLKEQNISAVSFISSAQVKSEFDDEAVISSDLKSVNRVINTFSNAIEEEIKIVENKMLVKSKIWLSVLYSTDEGDYERFENVISVNSILDVQGAKENDIAFNELSVSNLYIKPKADKNNEYRSFEIIGELIINTAIYRDEELKLPVDAYSTEREINPSFYSIELSTDYSVINDTLSEKVVINSDKQNISKVLDISASVTSDNGIEVNAFVKDENNTIYLLNSRSKTKLNECDIASINVISAEYIILSDNELEVKINLQYKALKYRNQSVNVINGIEETDSIVTPSAAITVYFADAGEDLWDIAKKFKTSETLIKKENGITKDTVDSKRILIIPGM